MTTGRGDRADGRVPARPGRRAVLGWLGSLPLAASGLAACTTEPAEPWSVERWSRERGDHYLVAHRGSGDVVPEHTIEAYRAALDWGARCLEVSVCRSSDGVLVCNHDLTLDRTTDLTGPVSTRTIAQLDEGRVDIPRLGPRWQGAGRPRIAHLDAVLDLVGDRAVMCLEAKDDSAFPALLDVVRRRELTGQVYVKAHASSGRIEQARRAGLPVFAYLGSAREVSAAALDALAARLDRARDVIVIPAFSDGGIWLADDLVRHALATGPEVWVYPLHRRSDVAHFADLGVPGALAASYGYLAGTSGAPSGPWPGDALRPGTITRFPDSDRFGLAWPEAGIVTLALQGEQHFVLVGDRGGSRNGAPSRLELDVEVRVDARPGAGSEAGTDLFAVSVGHADDRYVDLSGPDVPGHHVILGVDGSLSVARGAAERQVLARVDGPPVAPGQWVPLRVTVSDGGLTCARSDAGVDVTVAGVTLGAGYLHVGRVSRTGVVSVRGLTVVQS